MIICVSGAAGLVGAELVRELAARGHGVIALVHSEATIRANDGKPIGVLAFEGIAPEAGQVMVVAGDITQPSLGIDAEKLAAAQSMVDCVIHCAALVRFEAEFEDLRAVNVEGTLQIARCFQDARFVHVSTAYSCGIIDGPIPEAARPARGPFSNGYEKSKAIAEEELLSLRPDAIIARPSIVVGDYESGTIRSFDAIYRAFKFIAEGRIEAIPVAPRASLNFVPIDHVVCRLADLASPTSCAGEIIHLAARTAFPADQFLGLVRGLSGLDHPKVVALQAVPATSSGLVSRSLGPYLSYFSRNPEFETANADRLTRAKAPEMDVAALQRQIRYCIEAGFIRLG